MANIKSQKKRILTNEISRMNNKSKKSEMKTAIKKAMSSENSKKEKEALVNEAISLVDKALKSGIIKDNKAAREKSRLMKNK